VESWAAMSGPYIGVTRATGGPLDESVCEALCLCASHWALASAAAAGLETRWALTRTSQSDAMPISESSVPIVSAAFAQDFALRVQQNERATLPFEI